MKLPLRLLLLAAAASALCGGAAHAQGGAFCLRTIDPFASNNAGPPDGAVYFDLVVRAPVSITGLLMNYGTAAGLPVGVEVYTTPGTSIGNETRAAAWTLAAAGAGTSAGDDRPTTCALLSPLLLGMGSHGIALVATQGANHEYTDGTGSNQGFADANLSISLGAASGAPFAAPLRTPRVWNGAICYDLQTGLFPDFRAVPTSGSSPLTVQFTDASFTSDPGGITAFGWDFDADGNVDSTATNPSFTYTRGGTYSVGLTVTDSLHGPRSVTRTGLIVVDPVTASFTATPTTGPGPLQVQFTDTSTGAPTSWRWDFDGDGTPDSVAQHPSFTYAVPGVYTVGLTVDNGANTDAITRLDLIEVIGSTNNTASPELLEFQFNEVRGATVANTASTTAAPPHGLVRLATWQADPGRLRFMGTDPGAGCLGRDDVPPFEAVVDTGWNLDVRGSHSIAFWARGRGDGSFSYAFGVADGGTARCYHAGGFLSLRGWGIPDVDSATDPDTLAGWNHFAVVVDDAIGVAQWHLNGVPDGSPTAFTPGTFTLRAGTLLVGGYGGAATGSFTRYFDIDDFRFYGRALGVSELAAMSLSENPTTSTYGAGCPGPAGVPQIGASGGAPSATQGNPAFALVFADVEPARPAVANLSIHGTSPILPIDLSFLPTFAGCAALVLPDLIAIPVAPAATGSATTPLPVPVMPSLAGVHIYGQLLVLGSVQGAVSGGLDVNFE